MYCVPLHWIHGIIFFYRHPLELFADSSFILYIIFHQNDKTTKLYILALFRVKYKGNVISMVSMGGSLGISVYLSFE